METGKRIYFLSDAHLGTPDRQSSLVREKKLVAFLDEIKENASDIFLMGDLFDFWFEYKSVIPRGFSRILGKISELSDQGIRMHYFTGNHDIWMFNYLAEETGISIYCHPTAITIQGRHFFLAHGDGLDEYDRTFKVLKWIFTNRFLQWSFARLHPNFAFSIANRWSRHSRMMHGDLPFKGEKEPIVEYSRKYLESEGYDYLIFGHRHCPVDYPLNDRTRLVILGDWLTHFSYAVYDGETLKLKAFL